MADCSHLALANLFSVRGLVALVTGGGTGIGEFSFPPLPLHNADPYPYPSRLKTTLTLFRFVFAPALAANGATVYITGRRQQPLDDVVTHYSAGVEGKIVALQGDVSKKEDLQRLAKEIETREGGLHILVNNAGVVGPCTTFDKSKPLEQLTSELFAETQEDWNKCFEINNHALYFSTMAFLPLLAKFTNGGDERGRAVHPKYQTTVINISSISGYVRFAQNHFAYNSSKGAAQHLHRMLATEFSHTGIRFNCISPGLFPTEMTGGGPGSSSAGKSSLPEEWNGHGLEVPGRRGGMDEEMGGTILYLCSRAGQFTSGVILPVDGNTLAANPSCYN
ncbi:hypothetical protein JCM8097_002034 [Rhodosporidiobolus ruineniae]